MSWDLYLVPPDAGDKPGEWLEEHGAEGHNAPLARDHAEAVMARRPDLQLGGPYGDSYQLTLPEDSGLPLDIGLYGNHASISVAYWDLGERTAELGEIIVDVAVTLVSQTGWVLYDPQEDRLVEVDKLGALFGSGHADGVTVIQRLTSEQGSKKKRRFGLF